MEKKLICIPAYNEEMTIANVIANIRQHVPSAEIVVINDGSRDKTAEIVRQLGVKLIPLPCNLGYSRVIETGLRYALAKDYDVVVFIDADGQHDPAYLPGFFAAMEEKDCHMLIGSRNVNTRSYKGHPLGRRIGMVMFSILTGLLGGKRIYDTTSGMKGVRREAMSAILNWQFVDFHSEIIIYLMWQGFRIEEYPVVVKERSHGVSMFDHFSIAAYLTYPLSILLLIFTGYLQSKFYTRKTKPS